MQSEDGVSVGILRVNSVQAILVPAHCLVYLNLFQALNLDQRNMYVNMFTKYTKQPMHCAENN